MLLLATACAAFKIFVFLLVIVGANCTTQLWANEIIRSVRKI